MRLAALCALLALLALGLGAPPVRADGDPASDVLLGESVFYPYSPPVSASVEKALGRTTAAAARARLPIKVALIASPVDLGVIPDLFGKPQQYAHFLEQEIAFQKPQPLLVVMAAGYGVQAVPPAAARALARLPKPASQRTDDLARAAIGAVETMARATGRPIAATGPGSGSGGPDWLLIGLGALAVLVALGLLAVTLGPGRGRR